MSKDDSGAMIVDNHVRAQTRSGVLLPTLSEALEAKGATEAARQQAEANEAADRAARQQAEIRVAQVEAELAELRRQLEEHAS